MTTAFLLVLKSHSKVFFVANFLVLLCIFLMFEVGLLVALLTHEARCHEVGRCTDES